MENTLNLLVQWAGPALCLILFLLAFAGSGNREMNETLHSLKGEPDAYVLRYSKSGIAVALLIAVIGIAAEYAIGMIGTRTETAEVTFIYGLMAAQIVLALIVFLLCRSQLRRARGCAVAVSGDYINVFQAGGKNFTTSFPEIRTVKKEKDGARLVIRTEDRHKFAVDSRMSSFDRFAQQAERDVALPNLTKKRQSG